MNNKFKFCLCVTFTFLFICNGVMAHVTEGTGHALQFYSYSTNNPPNINGNITDATNPAGATFSGTNNAEWKDAYIRTIPLVDTVNNDTINTTIFFMNDSTSLYVGLILQTGNSANGSYSELLFDQGIGGGNHNNFLEGGGTGVNNGEFGVRVYHNKNQVNQQPEEYSFDGTAWVQQNSGAEVFQGQGINLGTSYIHTEYKIPLSGNPSAEDGKSYLKLTAFQELGFIIRFHDAAGKNNYTWSLSNENLTDAATSPGWMDLRLGVARSFTTFYSTFNANGNPVIDGNINGGATADDAWRGAYTRNLVLTDFNGKTLNAVLYAVEDATAKFVYVGLKVLDNKNDPGDFAQIFQEQTNQDPTLTRDFLLDNGRENSLIADENNFALADDKHWVSGTGIWTTDAANTTQNAKGLWYAAGYYEYEFLIDRGLTGTQDLNVSDNGLVGFQIKYHDAAGTGTDYYWELSPNSEFILFDANGSDYGSIGWPNMQFGAPYVQVIYPEDGASIEGVSNVRIYAIDETANIGIISAQFFREADTTTKFTLIKIAGTDEWAGTWNTQALSNGSETLVIRVTDNDGIVIDRLVDLTIANGSGSASEPVISVTSPTAGTTINGDVTIAFTTSTSAGATVDTTADSISIDGAIYISTTTSSTHVWNTSSLADGTHTIQLKFKDSKGVTATTQVIAYVVSNGPSVAITAPAADSTARDTITISFSATPVPPATIDSSEISIDGGAFKRTTDSTTHILATETLTDNAHTIQIKTTDNNGKMALSEILKINVNNSPTVSIDSSLADSTVIGNFVVNFTTGSISSATITATEISIDGGPWKATSTGSTDTLDTESFSDAGHFIEIRVTDSNGKQTVSRSLKIEIRNSPAVVIDLALADSVAKDTLIISFTTTLVGLASISTTEIRVDGGPWQSTTSDSTFNLATENLTDGTHTIEIRSIDSNGKTGTSQILTFVTDNSPPKISLPEVKYTGLNSSTKTGGTVLVTALAFDFIAGMDSISPVVFTSESGGLVDTTKVIAIMHDDGINGDKIKGDNIFSAIVVVNTDSTGSIEYSLTARDAVGNDTTLFSVIELDNSKPTVSYTLDPEPESDNINDTISGKVYVSKIILKGTAMDVGSGLDLVRITVRNDTGTHVNNSPMDVVTDNGKFSRIINLVPGINYVTLIAVDKAGNLDSLQGKITYFLPKVTELISPSGGKVTSPNGSSVKILPDALFDTKEITIRVVDQNEEPKPLNPDINLLGVPHEFGPDGTIFRKPVTITIAYNTLDLDPDQDGNPDYAAKDLSIYFWDGQSWVVAGNATVNDSAKTVSVNVNHFTMFDIVVNTSSSTVDSSDITGFWKYNPVKEHNPVTGSGGSVFTINVPLPGKLTFAIFDMAGDMVKRFFNNENVSTGIYNPMWKGENTNGNFAGAGLYIYLLRYESNDKSIKKTVRKPVGLLKN